MLEAYRTSLLPRFGKVLPLLRRARDFLTGFKEEILVLHCLGRVYADLAFDDETERYEELMGNAVRAFEEALALSPQYGSFMQVTLTAQLGNALNNMDEVEKALDMLETALSAVGSGREPNRFLALHLDIAQALTGRYVETSEKSDLLAAERASDRAFLISNSLAPSRVVPHVRFNLAMTLFTIAREKRDPERNAQAIHEIEKVLDIWTLDRFADLHFLAADTLCQFLAVQESMTRNPLVIDRAVSFLVDLVTRYNTEDLRDRRKKPLSVLYGHLSGFYFKRALHEEGEKRQEAYDLSETAARKSKELQME
jgi:tetratricopeptide (TPR) repeat protein